MVRYVVPNCIICVAPPARRLVSKSVVERFDNGFYYSREHASAIRQFFLIIPTVPKSEGLGTVFFYIPQWSPGKYVKKMCGKEINTKINANFALCECKAALRIYILLSLITINYNLK